MQDNLPPLDIEKLTKREKKRTERAELKRLVARILCEHEYNVEIFNREVEKLKLNIHLQRPTYQHIAHAIAYKVIRQIESFIIVNIQPNLQRLTLPKMKFAYRILLTCRQTFQEKACKTVFKFVQKSYNLGDPTIENDQVDNLYKVIIEQLQNRLGRWHGRKDQAVFKDMEQLERKKRIGYLTSIWNLEYEKHLMLSYRKYQNFGKIRRDFQAKFPKEREAFTSQSLSHQFYKVIKTIIRKTQRLIKSLGRWNFPPMVKLSGRLIRELVNPAKAGPVRWQLAQLYQKQNITKEEILKIICTLNVYFGFGIDNKTRGNINEVQQIDIDKIVENNKKYMIKFNFTPPDKNVQVRDILQNKLFDSQKGVKILQKLFCFDQIEENEANFNMDQYSDEQSQTESCISSTYTEVSVAENSYNSSNFYHQSLLNNYLKINIELLSVLDDQNTEIESINNKNSLANETNNHIGLNLRNHYQKYLKTKKAPIIEIEK